MGIIPTRSQRDDDDDDDDDDDGDDDVYPGLLAGSMRFVPSGPRFSNLSLGLKN